MARALDLHSRGQGFDSLILHEKEMIRSRNVIDWLRLTERPDCIGKVKGSTPLFSTASPNPSQGGGKRRGVIIKLKRKCCHTQTGKCVQNVKYWNTGKAGRLQK